MVPQTLVEWNSTLLTWKKRGSCPSKVLVNVHPHGWATPHKLAVIALKWAQFLVGELHPILSELNQPTPTSPSTPWSGYLPYMSVLTKDSGYDRTLI